MRHSHPCFKQLFDELSKASSIEERMGILRRTQQFADAEFPVHLAKLESLLLNYNPFIILATFAFIDLTYLPEIGRPMKGDGDIEQYHVELVQALILCHVEHEFQMSPIDPVQFQELRDLVTYVTYLHSARDIVHRDDTMAESEIGRLRFISVLKAHTKAVRNWSYEEQTIRVLKQLYGPIDDAIEKETGIRVSLMIDAVSAQLGLVGQRLQFHFTKVKSFIQQKTTKAVAEAYLDAFKDPSLRVQNIVDSVADGSRTFEEVRQMLFIRSNSFLLEIFAFDQAEFSKCYPAMSSEQSVQKLFSGWAMLLGDLKDYPREHLFLENPIWKRPIIRATKDVLFWPITPLFHGFCFEIIEAFVCQNAALKFKYEKRRAKFLEEYTAQLFREKFRDVPQFRGSKWEDTSRNRKGENDLFIQFDSIGLIVEQKSGSINPKARRGAPSIKRVIDELITDAAEQARAFEHFLKSNPTQHRFVTESGSVNLIDASVVRQYFCFSITLERFGPLAQLRQLQNVGLARSEVSPVPTMSLADLEIALELFESPFELLHYLTRRTAFEQNHTFIGDELDLLVFYFQTGFALGNLPESSRLMVLNGLGSKLDPYFQSKSHGICLERPRRVLGAWWGQIFEALERKGVNGRYEIGCILLDMSDEEQQSFEGQFRDLCDKVKKRGIHSLEDVEAIWNHVKSEVSDAVLVAVPISNEMHAIRSLVVENFALRAMRETGANQALVILVDIDCGHWPYSGIYLHTKT